MKNRASVNFLRDLLLFVFLTIDETRKLSKKNKTNIAVLEPINIERGIVTYRFFTGHRSRYDSISNIINDLDLFACFNDEDKQKLAIHHATFEIFKIKKV